MLILEIFWLGHSCFLMKSSKGKRILTDPFDIDIGYKPYNGSLDLVTISHDHFDHSYTEEFTTDTKILNSLNCPELDFCKIDAFQSFHDNYHGIKRGDNIIFKYEIDGFSICHLGDLGHTLSNDIIEKIGYVDVLFVPVGENFTLPVNEAKKVIEKIHPRYIVPMHYKTKYLSFFLNGVDKFLMKFNDYPKINCSNLFLSKDSLPNKSTIALLGIHSDDCTS